MMIRTLVVDDEPLAAELVENYVRSADFLEFVGSCNNATDAYERIAKGGVDLLFLDIQMPGISGLSLAKMVSGANAPKIVFTTAYGEYALDGFRVDAVDYLLKPFDQEEFLHAANKARHIIELEQSVSPATPNDGSSVAPDDTSRSFFVKSDYKLVKIDIDKIDYIEGLKDYVKIYLDDQRKPVITLSTMKQMEARLEPFNFLRVHRSFIVSLSKISGVERGGALINGTRIPIGEGFRQKFSETIEKMTFRNE